jgi:hypothetical protein
MNQHAVLFELNLKAVWKDLPGGPHDTQVPGRHGALDEMSESKLVTMINYAFKEGKAMMKRQVLELVRERYSSGLIKGWLNAFVGPHLDAL